MPLATKFLTRGTANVERQAACLRKGLQRSAPRARVTISKEGDIKVSAPTRRAIADVQEAVTRLERRCRL